MATIEWTADWNTGIAPIDEQHRRIIFYINALEQISHTGNASDIRNVMDGLVDYTITHFEFEEELQERAGYPFIKAHKRVHEIFRKRIAGFVERARNGEDVVADMLSVLRVWLISHINGDDRDYVDSVKRVVNTGNAENAGWIAATLKRLFGAQAPESGWHA